MPAIIPRMLKCDFTVTLTVPFGDSFLDSHYFIHKTKDNVFCQQSKIMSVGNRAWSVYRPINEDCTININGYSQMLSW